MENKASELGNKFHRQYCVIYTKKKKKEKRNENITALIYTKLKIKSRPQ